MDTTDTHSFETYDRTTWFDCLHKARVFVVLRLTNTNDNDAVLNLQIDEARHMGLPVVIIANTRQGNPPAEWLNHDVFDLIPLPDEIQDRVLSKRNRVDSELEDWLKSVLKELNYLHNVFVAIG